MSQSTDKLFKRSEVRKHNTAESLWVIYENKVCDMTKYLKSHPGGVAMLRQGGKDVTHVLSRVTPHSFSWNFIIRKLDECCIGRLEQPK